MVCLGNICRSPMADGILREKIKKYQLPIEVDSAGTAAYHVGEAPDGRMQETGIKNEVDISSLRARQFKVKDFDDFDIIFAMDQSNFDNIKRLSRSPSDMSKVRLMLNESFPGRNLEVPDPYYGGNEGFQQVFDMLDEAINAFLKKEFNVG